MEILGKIRKKENESRLTNAIDQCLKDTTPIIQVVAICCMLDIPKPLRTQLYWWKVWKLKWFSRSWLVRRTASDFLSLQKLY